MGYINGNSIEKREFPKGPGDPWYHSLIENKDKVDWEKILDMEVNGRWFLRKWLFWFYPLTWALRAGLHLRGRNDTRRWCSMMPDLSETFTSAAEPFPDFFSSHFRGFSPDISMVASLRSSWFHPCSLYFDHNVLSATQIDQATSATGPLHILFLQPELLFSPPFPEFLLILRVLSKILHHQNGLPYPPYPQ